MARSIKQIYDEIIIEKETFSSLNGLVPSNENYQNLLSTINSNSKVAFWRLFVYIHSVAIYIHELYFDKFKKEIEQIISLAPTGTPTWYRSQVFNFQLGDVLKYNQSSFKYEYPVIDITKQIVTRCAIQDSPQGVVLVKVATGQNGSLQALESSVVLALNSYLQKIKFAGTRLVIISQDGDKLGIHYKIYYDPIITLSTLTSAVQSAVETFMNDTLEFNGKLSLTKLTDVIQNVEGVIDPLLDYVTNFPFGGVLTNVDREVLPASGWFVLDNPISATCTFIPTP